ncbi:uncharacterized protein B0H18DRAFT_1124301 [Fomitopsis serialis]|uniref:uncharacterized protein n=1 Tax=Fomitopsis serialis TaxID=139415 RepID=UPI002008B73C|nr:uncharacterized protein B0H18DRAFT_1124301 [Neoantrodia serialis]KAH9916317.1 hypothetical protein B0H18DRAFT_1124301 [Neoantrodia serialis]
MASRYLTTPAFPDVQVPKPRLSPRKYLERRIIRAWKHFSQATRKQPRASVLPDDFVLLTARRRSVRFT